MNQSPSHTGPSSSSSSLSSLSNQPSKIVSSDSNSNHSNTNINGKLGQLGRKEKTTRMRTVLTEKQLLTLRACYGVNPRPDALMKEQLVEMTSLSPRVIRVWFQNKRKLIDLI